MTNRSYEKLCAAVVLVLFAALGLYRYSSVDGDDLSASYVGCRVLASGNSGHLYQHDPVDFSEMGKDDVWSSTAEEAEFYGTLHPYVQTPLWAFGLRPLCTRMDFQVFEHVFAALTMLCFAGSIWLIALFWAPSLMNPVGMAALVTVLWFSVPFGYAMALMQTHVLFFAMTIAALILAERGRPGWAGLLLAGAAAVKLTPGLLVVYWLLTRRWKAAASVVAWSCGIGAATWLAVGGGLTSVYLAEVHRISQVLLLAMNNQSLAAWWMGWFYPSSALPEMTMLPLPAALRVGSLGLMVGVTALGGWIDRDREGAPVGAMMGLIAATVFAPIAWTHYSIILLGPLMVLWQENLMGRRWPGLVAIGGTIVLCYRPFAVNVLDWKIGRYALVRSEFYACLLCMGTAAVVGWQRRRKVIGGAAARVDIPSEERRLSAVA